MNRPRHLLAIDQGTTSTRCIVFDGEGRTVALARRELLQHYPAAGWVEHDAEDIWRDTLLTAREALEQSGVGAKGIAAIGITNQRETAVVWERSTSRPIHRAIVWQDRRTADRCARLKGDGAEPLVRERTGLLLDPYFSGTKIAWLLDEIPGARDRRDERLAHDATRHPTRRVGRGAASPARRAARVAARGARQQR
jgi:glycerol kinase